MSEPTSKVRKRKSLNRKEAQALLKEASFLDVNALKVEEAETQEGVKVYLLDDEITLFRADGGLYPFLKCPCVDRLPAVVVDMGAIPYVCNGAGVMAPGIVEIKTPFKEGEIVVVRDVRHGKALSIGKALKSSVEIMSNKKGKVIENLHYVGDRIWVAKM